MLIQIKLNLKKDGTLNKLRHSWPYLLLQPVRPYGLTTLNVQLFYSEKKITSPLLEKKSFFTVFLHISLNFDYKEKPAR